MGEALPRNKLVACESCGKKRATHEYAWYKPILVCQDCRDMMASNIAKDAIKDRAGVLPTEERNEFLNKIASLYKK